MEYTCETVEVTVKIERHRAAPIGEPEISAKTCMLCAWYRVGYDYCSILKKEISWCKIDELDSYPVPALGCPVWERGGTP